MLEKHPDDRITPGNALIHSFFTMYNDESRFEGIPVELLKRYHTRILE